MTEAQCYRRYAIVERVRENEETATLILEGSLEAEPGQFVMVWVPGVDEKPFSLAGADPVELTVRRVGPVSGYLCGLGPGDGLHLRGPFGRGFRLRGTSLLLVGGGYGAAPLGFLASRAVAAGCTCVLAVGARGAGELVVPRSLLGGVSVRTATEDGSAGTRGLVTELAEQILDSTAVDCVYACGPNAMLDAVASLCRQRGTAAQLCFEGYMRCGVGVCGSCEREGLLVCRDGPVFDVEPAGR